MATQAGISVTMAVGAMNHSITMVGTITTNIGMSMMKEVEEIIHVVQIRIATEDNKPK